MKADIREVIAELTSEIVVRQQAIEALRAFVPSQATSVIARHTKGKRVVSASARARIAAAQKKRWAVWRKEQKRG